MHYAIYLLQHRRRRGHETYSFPHLASAFLRTTAASLRWNETILPQHHQLAFSFPFPLLSPLVPWPRLPLLESGHVRDRGMKHTALGSSFVVAVDVDSSELRRPGPLWSFEGVKQSEPSVSMVAARATVLLVGLVGMGWCLVGIWACRRLMNSQRRTCLSTESLAISWILC